MALAGVTGGELRIKRHRARRPAHDPPRLRRASGCAPSSTAATSSCPAARSSSSPRDVGEYKIKVQDGPWPAFPADLTSIAVALATQCEGSVLIHEWMFENRLIFTDKLVLMGADITLCDPHRAIVTRPARLRGERVESPGHPRRHGDAHRRAVRRRAAREIGNIRQIDRGYERIDERLRELGRAHRARRHRAGPRTPSRRSEPLR